MVELELPRAAPARALAPRGFRSLAPRLRGGCTQDLGTSGALQFQRILTAKERCWQACRPATRAGGVLFCDLLTQIYGFFSFEKRETCFAQDAWAPQRSLLRGLGTCSGSKFLVFLGAGANFICARLRQITISGHERCARRALKRFAYRELRSERRRSHSCSKAAPGLQFLRA